MAEKTITFNIKAVANMQDVITNINNIQGALNKLKLSDGLKGSFDKTFGNLTKEVERYQTILNKPNKTKGDISGLEKSSARIITLYDQIVQKVKSLDNATLKNAFKDLGAEQVRDLREQFTQLQNQLSNVAKSSDFAKDLKSQLNELKTEFKNTGTEAENLLNKNIFKTLQANLNKGRFDLVENNLKTIREEIESFQESADKTKLEKWIGQLENGFNKLASNGAIKDFIEQLKELKNNLSGAEAQAVQNFIDKFSKEIPGLDQLGDKIRGIINDQNDLNRSQQQFNSELDQVKSRIQYFFGLNNAIQLVKRTIRSAFDTIKELDKAMTETAVVTKFTVGDMWKQLPEYTKRANELGVTTKDAYEAATLYYQQGLSQNEVIALSNETLKMARIAGLEAAEATDRMTNAIRGFNMAINETNAQRIDDVYSRLAAISASNVDEISTAMTKVASLANNANMEFETTAAFLAQIIETTRESAETAGTALKTVVARFSEVKKLVNEGDLKGQDEEGQIIDVNKVSAALRTAGIDLNKYFIGEVGLDDIFMELASKWNSLTNIQQRYIATQAAGSRQQSRFIALMSNYARTQELVGEAYNSAGASAKQFEKTQESLQSKLARLKNAWNEFAMGIANNQIVKLAVDALTGLLNLVNSLTSGFGSLTGGVGNFISSLLKMSALSGTLKLSKGVLGATMGMAGASFAGKSANFGSLLKQNMGRGTLGTLLLGGKGGADAGGYVGKHLASGAVGKGTGGLLSLLGGASASTIIGAILGVASAILAVVAAYKLWETQSLKGQLKTTTKLAEKQREVADKTKETATNYKNLKEDYRNLTEQIDSTVDSSKRNNLIEQRNQAVLDAIKAEPSIGQYASVEKQGLEIVITIDEESFKKAADHMANTAKLEEQASYLYNAKAEQKQLEVDLDKLSHVDFSYREGSDKNTRAKFIEYTTLNKEALAAFDRLFSLKPEELKAYTGKTTQDLIDIYNTALEAQAAQTLAIGQYYGSVFKESSYSDDISNLAIKTLTEIFTSTGKTYKKDEIYGVANLISGNKDVQQLLSFFTGDFKDLSDEKIDNFISGLAEANSVLEEFADLLDIDIKDIQDQIKENREAEAAKRKYVTNELYRRGIFSSGIPSQDEVTLSMFTNAEKVLDKQQQGALKEYTLSDSSRLKITKEEAQEINDFFASIDLEDPIKAFNTLTNASKNTNDYIKNTAKDLLKLSKYDPGNLVQHFLTSDEYTELSEELQDLIKKNGELSASDIDALSKKYKSLDVLINKAGVSAKSLAKAFTLIEQGKISIESVTSSFLKVLDTSKTFKDVLNDIAKAVSDFGNIQTAGDTIDSFFGLIDKFGENVNEKGRLSPELAQVIFGKTFDTLEEAKAAYEMLNSFAENDGFKFFSEAAKTGIEGTTLTDLGNGKFKWDIDNITSYSQLIDNIKTAGKAMGLDMSDALAEYMIASFYEHGDQNFRNAVDALNSRDMFKSILDEFNGQQKKYLTAAQIEAMAAEVGMDPNEFWKQLSAYLLKNGAKVKTIGKYSLAGSKTTTDDLLDYFRQSLGIEDGKTLWKDILGDTFLKGSDTEGYTLDLPNIKLNLEHLGFTDREAGYAIQALNESLIDELGENYKPTEDIKLNNLAITIEGISDLTLSQAANVATLLGAKISEQLKEGVTLPEALKIIAEHLSAEYGGGDTLSDGDRKQIDTLVDGLISGATISDLSTLITSLDPELVGGPVGAYLKQKFINKIKEQIGTIPLTDLPVQLEGLSFVDENGNLITDLYKVVKDKVTEYNKTMDGKDPLFLTPTGAIQLKGLELDQDTLNKFQTLLDIYNGVYKNATREGRTITVDGNVIYTFSEETDEKDIDALLNRDKNAFDIIVTAEFGNNVVEGLRSQLIDAFSDIPVTTESPAISTREDRFYELMDQGYISGSGIFKQGEGEFALSIEYLKDLYKYIDNKDTQDYLGYSEDFYNNLLNSINKSIDESGINEVIKNAFQTIDYSKIAESLYYGIQDFGGEETDQGKILLNLRNFFEEMTIGLKDTQREMLSIPEVFMPLARVFSDTSKSYDFEDVFSQFYDLVVPTASAVKKALDDGAEASEAEAVASQTAADKANGVASQLGMTSDQLSAFSSAIAAAALALNGISVAEGSSASGGYVESHSNSLTGEEGPEIVWNKEKGYSYITGKNGPEYQQLQPGDRVFNAAETKRILRNSSHKLLGSNAAGIGDWNTTGGKGGSGGGGGSDKDKNEEWKNELDWIYNLMEDIAELERDEKKLQEQYNDYLEDQTKTGQDLYNVLVQQLANLQTQLNHQTVVLQKREQEMREFMEANAEYGKYLQYNWEDRTVEIDWNAIEAIQDKDLYEKVKEAVDGAEEIQDKMDDAEDAIMDINNKIQDLENIWRDEYLSFEKRVYEALVKSYQKVIDGYNELNDTLNNTNQNILKALQDQIALERQIRDNTETEQDITDQQQRLAFLRRDTTGGNEVEILRLQKDLEDQTRSYQDNLIDQAIDRLSEDNDKAAQQREKQIEIMQEQLDYQAENGEFNAAVQELLYSAIGTDGQLLNNSNLVDLLKEADNFNGMSAANKKLWEETLGKDFKQSVAYMIEQNNKESGEHMRLITEAITGVTKYLGDYSQAQLKNASTGGGGSGGGGGGGGGYTAPTSTRTTTTTQQNKYKLTLTDTGGTQTGVTTVVGTYNTATEAQAAQRELQRKYGVTGKITKYASGGLASFTGPAWLDGTSTDPEYVLNARQTNAFLHLADVLPAMMNGASNTNTSFGNTNISLTMNVESIGSDYDVDRLADRVKTIIYNAGTYRNVNSLNFLR